MASEWSCVKRRMLSSLLPQNLDAKQKVTVSYRYISWFITSIYYLSEAPYDGLKYKAVVVTSLLIFSRLIMDYYLKSRTAKDIQVTIVLETLGLTLLLVPTGGLGSPFIWYALNPVFIASNYLKAIHSWLSLFFYLLAALIVSSSLFNTIGLSMVEILHSKSYIILVYILITIAMRLLARLISQLDLQAEILKRQSEELVEMNGKLHEANSNVKRSMDYLMSLYRIIEAFSARGETRGILQQMVESTVDIMEGQATFLWVNFEKDVPADFMTQNFDPGEISKFQAYIEKAASCASLENQFSLNYKEMEFEVIPVRSPSRRYGYLGLERKKEQYLDTDYSKSELLIFLADMIAVILEREQLERNSAKLLILDEQNRIGNEIHDNVSQRLFSILCAIHALKVNWGKMLENDICKQLQLIEHSAKETSQELRVSIYRLSSSKRGEGVFIENIESYLQDFASLNSVAVKFEFLGDEAGMDYGLKQAIYRIIREATGNAVRHGKSTEMQIGMNIDPGILELVIKDNGQGFDSVSTLENQKNNGLGLRNIQTLTKTFGGIFNLSSKIGKGSEIKVLIPLGLNPERKLTQGGAA